MSTIKYVHPTSKEGLPNLPDDFIFPPHFLGLLLGKPGSGKTSLLKFMLTSDELFFKRFDYVYIISPSTIEFSDLFLPKGNFCGDLDFDWIDEKLAPHKKTTEYTNVLLILDDVVADLKSESTNKKLLSLIFNRRHKLENGMLSIITTSQKYKTLPTAMRVAATFLITFQIPPSEIKVISDELIYSNVDLEKLTAKVFNSERTFLIYNIASNKFYHEFTLIDT